MGLGNAMLKISSHSRQHGIYFAFSVPKGILGDTNRQSSRQTDALCIKHKFILSIVTVANCKQHEKFAANCIDLIAQTMRGR
jgi:hypothetical protein